MDAKKLPVKRTYSLQVLNYARLKCFSIHILGFNCDNYFVMQDPGNVIVLYSHSHIFYTMPFKLSYRDG